MFFGVLFSPTIPNLGCWGLKGPWWEVESWASIRSETAHWVRAPLGFMPWPPVLCRSRENRVAPRTGSYGSVCEAFDTSKRCPGHPAEGIWQSDIPQENHQKTHKTCFFWGGTPVSDTPRCSASFLFQGVGTFSALCLFWVEILS
jgi:hypothetical protein